MVVLGRDHDVGVGLRDLLGPARDYWVRVDAALATRRLRAIEERQREVAQVEQFGLDAGKLRRFPEDPVRRLVAKRPSRVVPRITLTVRLEIIGLYSRLCAAATARESARRAVQARPHQPAEQQRSDEGVADSHVSRDRAPRYPVRRTAPSTAVRGTA